MAPVEAFAGAEVTQDRVPDGDGQIAELDEPAQVPGDVAGGFADDVLDGAAWLRARRAHRRRRSGLRHSRSKNSCRNHERISSTPAGPEPGAPRQCYSQATPSPSRSSPARYPVSPTYRGAAPAARAAAQFA
jgi:hypothetical protein